MNRWKFRTGIVLVFVLGIVIGGLGTGWWFAHGYDVFRGPRDRVEAHIMKRLSRDLDLTDAQQAEIRPLVHDIAGQLQAIRDRIAPDILHSIDAGMARIRPKLTPKQYERLEHRYRELQERWKHRGDE